MFRIKEVLIILLGFAIFGSVESMAYLTPNYLDSVENWELNWVIYALMIVVMFWLFLSLTKISLIYKLAIMFLGQVLLDFSHIMTKYMITGEIKFWFPIMEVFGLPLFYYVDIIMFLLLILIGILN